MPTISSSMRKPPLERSGSLQSHAHEACATSRTGPFSFPTLTTIGAAAAGIVTGASLNLFPARPSVNQLGAACRRRSPNSFSFLVV
jgi:hypothetical protein